MNQTSLLIHIQKELMELYREIGKTFGGFAMSCDALRSELEDLREKNCELRRILQEIKQELEASQTNPTVAK